MFGKKRKYYETALNIVKEYFKIETNNQINPNFPGYLVYMDILSEAYHIKKATAEEAAAMLVIGYWGGMVESRAASKTELETMGARLNEFIRSSHAANKFDTKRAQLFIARISDFSEKYLK